MFDANPQTGIPDTAGYPVVHHGHLFSYPDGHPVVDYGSPQPPPADNPPKGEPSLSENPRAFWSEVLRRIWREREAKPEAPTLTPPPVDPSTFIAFRDSLQAQWERNHPPVASPIPDYDAVDIPAVENPLQETVFALADEQEAEARRTATVPKRPDPWVLPIREDMEPEKPTEQEGLNLELILAVYAVIAAMVLSALAVGLFVGILVGVWKGGVQ